MREIGILNAKNKKRDEIQAQVDEYVAKGGKVKSVDMGVFTNSKKLSYNTDYTSLARLADRDGN